MSDETSLAVLEKDEAPLSFMKRGDIPAVFKTLEDQIAPLEKIANDLQITSADQTAEIAIVRTTRLSLKKLRCMVVDRHEEMKKPVLDEGRKIDEAKNRLVGIIEPLEKKLLAQEKIGERLEAERKAKLVEERGAELLKYGVPSAYMALGDMPQESYDQLLENSRAAFEAKKAEALRLEQERIRLENDRLIREKEEAAERERVKAENARLKAEAEERERKSAEERAAAEAKLKAEREAAEAKLEVERAKAERERQTAEEKARKEREAIEAKARAEKEAAEAAARKEREAREAEEKKKRIAENKAKAAREAEHAHALAEANRKAEEASRAAFVAQRAEEERAARELQALRDAEHAAEEAAKAPDKIKLTAYADSLLAVPLPALNTEAGNLCLQRVEREVKSLAEFILKKAGSM
jgi:hypothetical protein